MLQVATCISFYANSLLPDRLEMFVGDMTGTVLHFRFIEAQTRLFNDPVSNWEDEKLRIALKQCDKENPGTQVPGSTRCARPALQPTPVGTHASARPTTPPYIFIAKCALYLHCKVRPISSLQSARAFV